MEAVNKNLTVKNSFHYQFYVPFILKTRKSHYYLNEFKRGNGVSYCYLWRINRTVTNSAAQCQEGSVAPTPSTNTININCTRDTMMQTP